ncbi:MAG: S49 family peptidase [Proteobacteria bacterium]|nr:S49 family peptidase [Pseudomonadota bacterium]
MVLVKLPFARLFSKSRPVVPVLRFAGPIGAVTPLRPGLNLTAMAGVIHRAFAMKGAKAVAIQINSPGGSAVQSMLIYKRIRDLADEKGLPVYVFAEDVAASGGYLIALAGDEIYVDASSIIGSIGVVATGFGFDKAIKRLGIQRRVYTAGDQKVLLDPFQPEKPDEVERLKELQADVHETFVDLVKQRRGRRIKKAGDKLFTGEFWSGKKAVELGLVDGISDMRSKMRELVGKKVRLKPVTPKRSLFSRRLRGVFSSLPDDMADGGMAAPSFADDLISAVEARALWSRFGL